MKCWEALINKEGKLGIFAASFKISNLEKLGLYKFSKQKVFDDEVIREMEHNLDLEEARFNGH